VSTTQSRRLRMPRAYGLGEGSGPRRAGNHTEVAAAATFGRSQR
jgi:hypothetical protein